MLHSPKPPVGEPVPTLVVERKFGLRENMRAAIIAEPNCIEPTLDAESYASPDELPTDGVYDYIHIFVRHAENLEDRIGKLAPRLTDEGMLWVSFPIWSSPMFIDVTEEDVRAAALPFGLVDIKAKADTDDWRAIKLIPRHAA